MCVSLCGSLHYMNEVVRLLNLTSFICNFYTWLIVMLMHSINGMSPRQIPVYI